MDHVLPAHDPSISGEHPKPSAAILNLNQDQEKAVQEIIDKAEDLVVIPESEIDRLVKHDRKTKQLQSKLAFIRSRVSVVEGYIRDRRNELRRMLVWKHATRKGGVMRETVADFQWEQFKQKNRTTNERKSDEQSNERGQENPEAIEGTPENAGVGDNPGEQDRIQHERPNDLDSEAEEDRG